MGNRGGAGGDIEDLASKLYCRRADRDFACRDSSDRGIAPERGNATHHVEDQAREREPDPTEACAGKRPIFNSRIIDFARGV